ncbi:MAG TPA: nucleotide-binding protein [Actinobacteria bacterium]|nr:nucleotide-binding protein [Actinomycetota bacterium]
MTSTGSSRTVFVVHGRNAQLRDSMFDFLRSLDLAPLEWLKAVELTGNGSPYVGEVLDAAFDNAAAVVVLFSPDEIAYLIDAHADGPDDPETRAAPQARPNVLFEAGMAIGRDPRRTILVEVGPVRPFSDVAGRHVVRLDNTMAARQALATRLRTAGCAVDSTGTRWHNAGDFSPPPVPGHATPLGRRVPSVKATRPTIDFDLRYVDKGSRRLGKLQVINRGSETAYEVHIDIPDDASLSLYSGGDIEKIPGQGKSVTVDVQNSNAFMGGPETRDAFDVTVSARNGAGEAFTQEIFMDVNG